MKDKIKNLLEMILSNRYQAEVHIELKKECTKALNEN